MKTRGTEKRGNKNSVLSRIGRYAGRFFIWFGCTLLILVVGLYFFLFLINKGPSKRIRDLFVASAKESSVGGIMADIYLSQDEINEILSKNNTTEFEEITDIAMVKTNSSAEGSEETTETETIETDPSLDPDGDGIDIFDVHGDTYKGKMMVVYDPSRVKVATLDYYDYDAPGLTLAKLVEKYDCVAGVNGGKYDDEIGLGNGGMPEGVVFSEGKLRFGDPGTSYDIYGFTNEDVLVVGRMTAGYAMSIGVRDAVSFGPALIVNGKSASYSGSGSGLNPRTAIGQRANGDVLLLVIEGRQPSSLGATMGDLIEIMEEFGAVNAANLDGGMSSSMVYNNEDVVSSCTLGSRAMPSAFVVEKR
ncbi:MAG: phosphodiester glycosidase family protein [Lachnospiraceae bacterium]|nr:phosphodiester glycosidase family protein [Lachnospiraceae bacterium]